MKKDILINKEKNPNSEMLAKKLMDAIKNPKPLTKPPYKCPNTHDRRIGNGCNFPNRGCEWYC